MQKRIILESRFTSHQKQHISIITGLLILVPIVVLINANGNIDLITQNEWRKIGGMLGMAVVTFLSIFTKKGLLEKGKCLYSSIYLFNYLVYKKKVDLVAKTKLAILKMEKRQKAGWFSVASPDLSLTYERCDIALLNDKHTEKEILISLDSEELAVKTIRFLEENFKLSYETYSPDFS